LNKFIKIKRTKIHLLVKKSLKTLKILILGISYRKPVKIVKPVKIKSVKPVKIKPKPVKKIRMERSKTLKME